MSRRKQAKPRPIFVYEEEVSDVPAEDVYVPVSQSECSITQNGDTHQEDREEFGEFAPLVVDTSSQEERQATSPPLPSPTPTPPSIKPIGNLPSLDTHTITPEPIKQFPTKESLSLFFNHSAQSAQFAQALKEGNKKLAGLPRFNSASSFATALSSSNSNDGLTFTNTIQNPQNSDDGSSVSDSTSVPTSPSVARRGSKRSNSELEENDENLDKDPDFADLEELLKELIRNKILPVSDENGEKFICPICNVSLLNLHDLTVHIRSHNSPASGNQSNTCKICNKVLSSQSSLDRHMLVHSGERPFVCKVCNMSFTTNGNMHRHARIHTKEENMSALGNNSAKLQMRKGGKTNWRHHLGKYLTQTDSPMAERMKMMHNQDFLQTLPNHSHQSLFGRPTENLPSMVPNLKRPYSNGPEQGSDWSIPFKRQSLENNNDIYKTYNYTMNTIKGEQPHIKEEVMEDNENKPEKDLVNCAVPKTFPSKNGLEDNLESQKDTTTHCDMCNLDFDNSRKFRVHCLIAHSDFSKENKSETDGGKLDEETEIGFHDLSFVDFSVDKFPLIAKHFFEENARLPSSMYLNFTCKQCSKAFPCETSLFLHSFSHTKDKATRCPICESDYATNAELHTHMLKHLADNAFEEIRPSSKNETGTDDLTPDSLQKHDFLAMFDLKEDETPRDIKVVNPEPKKEEVKATKSPEKKVNNEYFAKLGQVFGAGLPPMFSQFPFFPPGYQPTLDDFHKMLQIATNMNALPSMGAGLLKKGFTGSSAQSPSKIPAMSPNERPQTSPSPVPAHSNKRSALISSPQLDDRQSLSGPEKEINDIKMQNSNLWSCKYCDNTFNSIKALEVHIRTHLGHSPYQCNLCAYMTQDKSSLIRHIRTHTGSRPFQCLECDYAFTTRANCERHIRQCFQHQKIKQCNLCAYMTQDKSSLIRHIRTHTGTRPFQCLECDYAFTTRANCERHIRTKHQIELREDIDRFIYINRNALEFDSSKFHSPDTICKYCCTDFKYFRGLKNHLRSHIVSKDRPFQCVLCKMGFCAKSVCIRHIHKSHPEVNDIHIDGFIKVVYDVDSRETDTTLDEGIPLYSVDAPEFSPFDYRSDNGTPQPPAAHSTPKPDSLVGRSSRHVSPSHVSPSRHISPQSRISPAPSPLVVKAEPDDASRETPLDFSRKSVSDAMDMSKGRSESDETPMDLSCKKSTSPDLSSLHGHLTSGSSLAAHFVNFPLLNSEGKLLLPPKSSVPPFHLGAAKGLLQPSRHRNVHSRGKTSFNMLQTLQDKIKLNQKRDNIARAPSGMEPDLASVRKMIDTTDALNFQAFFNPDLQNDKPSSSKPNNLPNILRRPGVQISLEHCNAINRELDNLQREGDVDEVALSQVREMALSVKEECVNNAQTTLSMTLPTITAPITSSASPPHSDVQQEDENSGDGSLNGKVKSEGEGENAPVKKKRNSYADSPHKLACPYCPRAFPWVSSLTRHLLTHTGQKPFKCPRCPVTFSTKSNRERHLIRKHGVNMLDPMSRQTMDRPYKCPLCVFSSFSTQSNLLKHYRDRHNGINLPDNIADIERMSPTAIKAATLEMESRAAENPPQLDDSNINMAAEEEEEDMDNSLDSDEKMDDESSYAEIEVGEELTRPDSGSEISEASVTSTPLMPATSAPSVDTLAEIMTPKIAPHLLMRIPEPKRILDEFKESKLQIDLKKDVREKEEREESEKRAESPNTMAANINRIIAEQKRIIEQKAQMEMKIQAEIRAQIEAQRKADIQVVSPQHAIDTLTGPRDPTKPFTGSAERIINPERDNYDVDKITECWKCKSIFPSRKVLVRHLKEHNIDLPFKCYLCDASFDSRMECLHHQDKFHSSDWKILKDKNKVLDIEQFATHMDKVVENNCNKLDSGSVLEIPGTGLDESKMEVISADYMQRKVYCSLCPKRFWSLQDLRRHMRSHTGERPFECDICQKRFTLKHSMMRHRKKHIGAPPRTFDDDEDSNGLEARTGMKLAKPTPTRPPPNMYSFQGGLPFTAAMTSEGLPMNTFMFNHGFSGSTLTFGGSNLGALTAVHSPKPSVSTVTHSESTVTKSPAISTPRSVSPAAPTIDSVKKEFLDCNADMLHNLLGVESAEINKMIDSADSQTAAKFLGITNAS